jgi:FkbM family methyltransferase
MDPQLLLPRAAAVGLRVLKPLRPASVSRRIDVDWLYVRLGMVRASGEVTDATRFALNELLLQSRVRGYRLRGSGQRIFVRHPFADAWIIDEVMRRETYRPPAVVMDDLRRLTSIRIIDAGAHIGTTTLYLLSLFPTATVTALEPNPQSAALLRAALSANGLDGTCTVVQAAAGVSAGSAVMEGYSLLARVVREGQANGRWQEVERSVHAGRATRHEIPVIDVLPLLAEADLVKLDIEGAEWDILADERLARTPVRALVMEYHPQGCPGEDATATVRAMLAQAGFCTGEPFDQQAGGGMIWAWRAEGDPGTARGATS